MKRKLVEAGGDQFEKIRNFLDNAGPITVQQTLEGTVERESVREADATRYRREEKLEELREDARIEKELDEQEASDKELDPLRARLHDLDEKLNELSKGLFYGEFALWSLECHKAIEMRRLAKKLDSAEFMDTLKEAVRLSRDFYLRYNEIETLSDISENQDSSMHNIAMMCKWLGIRPDRAPEIPTTFFD